MDPPSATADLGAYRTLVDVLREIRACEASGLPGERFEQFPALERARIALEAVYSLLPIETQRGTGTRLTLPDHLHELIGILHRVGQIRSDSPADPTRAAILEGIRLAREALETVASPPRTG